MGNSWGHAVRRLTDREIALLRSWDERRTYTSRYRNAGCRTGKCDNDATHVVSYRYITGRGFRVSSPERNVCDEHAAKFRAKHGLSEPTSG
jgi:hypothetical protein